MTQNFNFIVIGAGSAGCAIANRLTQDPGVRVLLLEAGGWDRDLFIHLPLGWGMMIAKGSHDWGYFSEPEASLDNREIECARGRIIGGCSSTNAMAYVRGNRADYDRWAASGLPGWSYEDMLPYFRKQENWEGGADHYRGSGGPLQTSGPIYKDPIVDACMTACEQAGLHRTPDYNGAQQEGFGPLQATIGNGRRSSTASAYLRPVLKRPNLTVVTLALTRRIVIENGRATGVEYTVNGEDRVATAQREVIVCTGSINSPQLLKLSGIGPAEELNKHGIAVIKDLPGVGENLRDHLWAPLTLKRKGLGKFAKGMRWDKIMLSITEAVVLRSGFFTQLPSGFTAFLKTDPSQPLPDVQFLFLATLVRDPRWPFAPEPDDGFQFRAVMLRPKSAGSVKLRSADPNDPVAIHHDFLQHEDDLRSLRGGLRMARKIVSQPAFAPYLEVELAPGPQVTSDEQLDAYIRSVAMTAHHPAGTCKMGVASDPMAVVDGELKVLGIDALRVVDASIMPDLVGGNINAAVIAIAEKAADMIAASWSNRQPQRSAA